MTPLENQTLPYLDHKRAGRIPPHLLPALHLYLRAVRAGVVITANAPARIARAARLVRLVDTHAEAMALEATGASMWW